MSPRHDEHALCFPGRVGRALPQAPPGNPCASAARARITEVGEILTAGYLRLLARKSRGKASPNGEIPLDISSTQSGHRDP